MLNAFLPFWVLQDHLPRLSKSATKVYLALLQHADFETHSCFPSYDRLQQVSGAARATVTKGLRELAAAGLIQISQGSRRRSQTYLLAQDPDQAELWASQYVAPTPKKQRAKTPLLPFPAATNPTAEAPSSSKTELLSSSNSELLSGSNSELLNNNHHNPNQENKRNIKPELFHDELSALFDVDQGVRAHRYMMRCGIRGQVPHDLLLYNSPEQIIEACKNALALGIQRARRFNLNGLPPPSVFNVAGYVIRTLNKAREARATVTKSRLRRRLDREASYTDEQRARRSQSNVARNKAIIANWRAYGRLG